jgi:hypothetical protein
VRSVEPMPGNPWPHDMVLRIQDDEQGLLDLLWVRAAWELEPTGDVPPAPVILPVSEPTTQSLRRDKGDWASAWSELWWAVLAHLGRPHRSDEFQEMRATGPGSEERRRLLKAMMGPSWRDRFGADGFDDGYDEWVRSISRQRRVGQPRSLEEDPERRNLDATISAWERGLETIVTIPCVGEYNRTISGSGLCVPAATRSDPALYSRALQSFGR